MAYFIGRNTTFSPSCLTRPYLYLSVPFSSIKSFIYSSSFYYARPEDTPLFEAMVYLIIFLSLASSPRSLEPSLFHPYSIYDWTSRREFWHAIEFLVQVRQRMFNSWENNCLLIFVRRCLTGSIRNWIRSAIDNLIKYFFSILSNLLTAARARHDVKRKFACSSGEMPRDERRTVRERERKESFGYLSILRLSSMYGNR